MTYASDAHRAQELELGGLVLRLKRFNLVAGFNLGTHDVHSHNDRINIHATVAMRPRDTQFAKISPRK
jgi:hypothetical protein